MVPSRSQRHIWSPSATERQTDRGRQAAPTFDVTRSDSRAPVAHSAAGASGAVTTNPSAGRPRVPAVGAQGSARAWERYAWAAGIIFVVALVGRGCRLRQRRATSAAWPRRSGGIPCSAGADRRHVLRRLACRQRRRHLRVARIEARVVRGAPRSGHQLHAVPDDIRTRQPRSASPSTASGSCSS